MFDSTYDVVKVPVDGGELTVGRWGSGPRTVVAAHGVTANHTSFHPLADALGDEFTLNHQELIAATTALEHPGAFQARELAAMADGRAVHAGESVLRLRWYDANLPTPTPALGVAGIRLALGLPTHRFGVVLTGQAQSADVIRCAHAGWRVLLLDRARVLSSDPVYLIAHLEREFHQHLLSQVG